MLKFVILYFVILIAATCAVDKEHRIFPDIMDRFRRMSTNDDLRDIAVKKHLFQDIFTEHQKDDKLQFGYVCENPIQWEQRFEERDLLNNRHRGKMKWGDVDGAYGEQYWDLNHK